MTIGGSGFCVLLAPIEGVDYRLAHLQVIKDVPPHPEERDGEIALKLYQLDNKPLWDDMLHDYPDHFSALRAAARDGRVVLLKLIKSPAGEVRKREYILSESEWVAEGTEKVATPDFTLPMTFTIYNITSRMRVDAAEKITTGMRESKP